MRFCLLGMHVLLQAFVVFGGAFRVLNGYMHFDSWGFKYSLVVILSTIDWNYYKAGAAAYAASAALIAAIGIFERMRQPRDEEIQGRE